MEKSVLVMIVSPLMGHMTQALEMAKLMLDRNNQISVTVLIMKLTTDPEGTNYIQSIATTCAEERLQFLHLPTPEDTSEWCCTNRGNFVDQLIEFEKPYVIEMVSKMDGVSGFIIDLMTTTMIDVADELGVPSYIFFTSGAAFLGLLFHFQALEDEQNDSTHDLLKNTTELNIPSFAKPVPVSAVPTVVVNEQIWNARFLRHTRGYRKAKAIMVNTFAELEAHALNSFLSDSAYGKSKLPPIYPVGPILNRFQNASSKASYSEIIEWLDAQPHSSVVFLCFGSMGSFHPDQIKEIAHGLEQSGHKFLLCLRQPPSSKGGFPTEYENHGAVLPEGFLDRTAKIGKVVGWAPQLAALSHSAVGGFVSHCGWNSTLESIWCGVPIASWPQHGEQQLNAFQLVKELGMAVEISLDYNESKDHQEMVTAEEIEKGIRRLMDGENEVRKRVKQFCEKSRLAMKEGGSSYLAFENLIQSIRLGAIHLKGP